MLALRKVHAAPGVELQDVPEPRTPEPDEVLIEIAATGLCGTDLHIDEWTPGYRAFMGSALPVTIGHEASGRIVKAGARAGTLKEGDRVVINPAVACGKCASCIAGIPDDCRDRQAIGLIKDGACARYMLAPASYAYRLPDNVPTELGALAEPLTTSAHALATAEMAPGKRVIVFGPGPIGQGAAVLARQMGASDVVVVGMRDEARLQTLAGIGFRHLIDMAQSGAAQRLAEIAGDGFDIAIEAAGAPGVVDQALSLLKPWGVLALAGMPEGDASFNVLRVVRNRLQIRGVSRTPRSAWTTVLEAMAKEPDAFAPIVTHRVPLRDAMQALALCHSRQASKVLVIPG
jgi:2-desacetyl-2-hydroxyethyl bacteriochlorophyllide A dehydrogenase